MKFLLGLQRSQEAVYCTCPRSVRLGRLLYEFPHLVLTMSRSSLFLTASPLPSQLHLSPNRLINNNMAGRHTGGSSVAGTTVYGGDDVPTRNFSFKGDSKGKGLAINGGAATEEEDHSDVALSQNYLSVNRPFFVPVDEKTGLLEAFRSLDQQLKNAGRSTILSKKTPKTWIGRTVEPVSGS